MSSTPTARERLAARIGLELSYQTIWGHIDHISEATEKALVAALTGVAMDPGDEQAAEKYLAGLAREEEEHLLAGKTYVELVSQPLARIAGELEQWSGKGGVELYVSWENGSTTCCELGDPAVERLAVAGYHKLRIRAGGREVAVQWILTPSRCLSPEPGKPLQGINVFLPSLRSERNWGCGDLTDLVAFGALLGQHAPFDLIALNPLHAIHNRTPYNTSPYLPLSIFTRNLLYLDVEAIPEFSRSKWAKDVAGSASFQAELTRLRSSSLVEYEQVAKLKTFFLLLLYRQYCRERRQSGRDELGEYRAQRGPWLEEFCAYMAMDRYFHRRDPNVWHWRQWPEANQCPGSDESVALRGKLSRQMEFRAYIEMQLERQIAAAHEKLQTQGYAVGLYQDLALATDRVGADYWAYQDLFAAGVRVGSPPDDFNENGQDWGFPALHPQRHCDAGYRYFVESIRCAAAHAGAIRLDHVMRLARLYWIPDEMSARYGAYVRDRFEDLLRILALESQRGGFFVVGEDLGTVPDYFRHALDSYGILSYRLILFERDGARFRPASEYPVQAIASFTTHDLSTFQGWLSGADLRARVATGQLQEGGLEGALAGRREAVLELGRAFGLGESGQTAEDYYAGLCEFLSQTPSVLRLLNLEELTAETEQQNMPGTTWEAPNWQHRIAVPMEQLFEDPAFLLRIEIWKLAQSRSFVR